MAKIHNKVLAEPKLSSREMKRRGTQFPDSPQQAGAAPEKMLMAGQSGGAAPEKLPQRNQTVTISWRSRGETEESFSGRIPKCCSRVFQPLATRSAICEPASLSSSGSLIEMQNLSSLPRPAESQSAS